MWRMLACSCGNGLMGCSGRSRLYGNVCSCEHFLLNGQSATTSWWLAPLFRELYPLVTLEESRMVVSSSRFVTAGAALAHIDLALWLVRRSSPTLAALTARFLVIEPRPSQAIFAIPDHLTHEDPLVERFEQWARRRLAGGFSLGDAASAASTSERTLPAACGPYWVKLRFHIFRIFVSSAPYIF